MTPRDLRVGGAVTVTPPAVPIVTPTWAETLVAGDESGGTSPVISTGDELLGETDLDLRAQGSGTVTLGTAGDATLELDQDELHWSHAAGDAQAHISQWIDVATGLPDPDVTALTMTAPHDATHYQVVSKGDRTFLHHHELDAASAYCGLSIGSTQYLYAEHTSAAEQQIGVAVDSVVWTPTTNPLLAQQQASAGVAGATTTVRAQRGGSGAAGGALALKSGSSPLGSASAGPTVIYTGEDARLTLTDKEAKFHTGNAGTVVRGSGDAHRIGLGIAATSAETCTVSTDGSATAHWSETILNVPLLADPDWSAVALCLGGTYCLSIERGTGEFPAETVALWALNRLTWAYNRAPTIEPMTAGNFNHADLQRTRLAAASTARAGKLGAELQFASGASTTAESAGPVTIYTGGDLRCTISPAGYAWDF